MFSYFVAYFWLGIIITSFHAYIFYELFYVMSRPAIGWVRYPLCLFFMVVQLSFSIGAL